MDNRTIAQRLLDMAHTLEEEHASLYRVQAYRRAAETILGLDRSLEEIVIHDGRKALRQLPGIGVKMSVKIETLVRKCPSKNNFPVLPESEEERGRSDDMAPRLPRSSSDSGNTESGSYFSTDATGDIANVKEDNNMVSAV